MTEGGLVFVSYSHEDRDRISPLVQLLDHKLREIGGSLFWDPLLHPGAPVSNSVAKLLNEAACVVVGWSENSVKSQWVHGECEKARVDGRLVPIKIDSDADIPPPFNALKHVELINWDGEETPEFDLVWERTQGLVQHGAKAGQHYQTLADDPWAIEDAAKASQELRQLVHHFRSINEVLIPKSPAVQDLREAFKQVFDTYKIVTKVVQQFFGAALKPGLIDPDPYVAMAYRDLPNLIEEGRGHCGQILVHYKRVGGARDEILNFLSKEDLKQVDDTFEDLGGADQDVFMRMTRIGGYLEAESLAIVNNLFQKQEEVARARIMSTKEILDPLHKELSLAMKDMQQLGASLGHVS